MVVRDLLQKKPPLLVTIDSHEHVGAAARLLLDRGVGSLVVMDDHTLSGIVGERDIVAALHRNPGDVRHLRVSTVMRQPPTCSPEDSVTDVMQRMSEERLRHLVVVEHGTPVGVISVGDIVRQRVMELETETGVLRDYVAAHRAI